MKIKADKNLRKLAPKEFILKHLIPFIMRDAGRGFIMEDWIVKRLSPKNDYTFDNIDRKGPACGTAACIGGSIQCLTGMRYKSHCHIGCTVDDKTSQLLGLSPKNAYSLFYNWDCWDGWPKKHAENFKKATTPFQKAKVACSLLREIAKKGDKVFQGAR